MSNVNLDRLDEVFSSLFPDNKPEGETSVSHFSQEALPSQKVRVGIDSVVMPVISEGIAKGNVDLRLGKSDQEIPLSLADLDLL